MKSTPSRDFPCHSGHWRKGRRIWLDPLLLLLVGVALVWLLDPALQIAFAPGVLWRNALPVALLLFLIYGLSGRVLLAVGVGAGIVWILFKANAIKVLNMNAPLMPSDAVLGPQILHNAGFFSHYAGHRLVLLILGALVFVVVLGALWRIEKSWRHPGRLTRIGWIALPVLLLATLFRGVPPWTTLYRNSTLPGFLLYDPMNSVRHVGYMATMVRLSWVPDILIPQGDKTLVTTFAQQHASDLAMRQARAVPSQLPDIVVVQSEAFFDPGVMKGIDYGEYDPNFHRLAVAGISGALTTPTYGGGTIRTEFETLTGYPMAAFPSVAYPYYGLVGAWMPSVPRRLAALGYSTSLFHPFKAEFWNRQIVMPELGFQHSYYRNAFAESEHAGVYVSDHGLFNFLLAHFDEGGNGPHYAMAITMENHGIWDHDPGQLSRLLDGHPLSAALSPAGRMQMNYYLSHLVNGDEALGDFARKLMARPRWTILIFYGDHLPALTHAFNELGFDNGLVATEQHTRYLLLSNRTITPRQLDLNAYELPALLFDIAGLPEDGYLGFDSEVRQTGDNADTQQRERDGQVAFSAAQLEVACRQKLTLAGACVPAALGR